MAALQDSENKFFETYVQKNLALNDLKQAFYDQMVDTSNLESAATYAEQAAASAASAAAVVTGGTATLTPEAGKIPLADGAGKIANGWLPASPTFTSVVATRNDLAQVANYRNTAAAYRTDIVIGNDATASMGGLAGYGSASSGAWGSDRVNTVGLYANTGYGLSFVSGEHITFNTNGFANANQRLKIDKTTGNLTPGVDNIQDFGTSSYKWRNGHFAGRVYAGSVQINQSTGQTALTVVGGSGATQAQLVIGYVGTSVNYYDGETQYWRDAYANNRMVLSSTGLAVTGNATASTYTKSGSYTVATVPSASASGAGARIYVTDSSGGSNAYFSDGTTWRNAARTALA